MTDKVAGGRAELSTARESSAPESAAPKSAAPESAAPESAAPDGQPTAADDAAPVAPAGAPASHPREPRWRVARSAIKLWTVQAAIGALFFLLPAIAAAIFVPDNAPGWLVLTTDIAPWALAAFSLVEIVVVPRYKYAVHRWEVTADGIYTLTGWLSRTWVLVPISRIQTVDVTRGPMQRMFGLSTISVRTASAHGSVEIDQLDARTAAKVADDLSRRANLFGDDAT